MTVTTIARAPAALLSALALLALLSHGAAGCTDSHSGDAGATDGAADARRDTGGGGLSACTASSDCMVVPESCCGSCGGAARGDALAINIVNEREYRGIACEGDRLACPPCYTPTDPTLVATCNAGTCEVVDLLTLPLSECVDGMDCRLRTQSCCECGGDTSPEGLIAIPGTSEAAYTALVCDDGPATGCPECAPVYPPEASAVCGGDGRCAVEWDGTP